MGNSDFNPVFEGDSPFVAYDIFVAIFTMILNEVCPLRGLKGVERNSQKTMDYTGYSKF